jgi:hypothetical protein
VAPPLPRRWLTRHHGPAEVSTREIRATVMPCVPFGLLMLAPVMATPGLATRLPTMLPAE